MLSGCFPKSPGSTAIAAPIRNLPGGGNPNWWRRGGGCRGARGGSKAAPVAMANLAEAIQGLVQHMRSEQQMIRDWADEQAKLNRDLRRFMEQVAREPVE